MATPERPTPPPRPKLGAKSKASAPSLRGGKGFVPPTIHRQKVAVERAHETPVAPPTVEPVAPPTVSTSKVVGESPMPIAPSVDDASVREVARAEQAASPAPRVRPVRIPPRPIVEEPAQQDEPVVRELWPQGEAEQQSEPIADSVAAVAPSADSMAAPEVIGPAELNDPARFAAEPTPEPLEAAAPIIEPPDELEAQDDCRFEAKRVVPPPAVLPVEIVAATDLPHSAPRLGPKASASAAVHNLPDPPPESGSARRPLLRYYGGGVIGLSFLLLSALMAGFWVHSFGAIDRALHATTAGQYYWLESSAGAIYFHTERDPTPVERQTDVWRMEFGDPYSKKDPPPNIPGAAVHGVTVAHVPGAGAVGQVRYVVVSYWLVVIVLALPGLWWLRQRRRLQEMCRGLRCLRCGYDLRHSPERCPECGAANQVALVAAEMRRRFAEQ